MSMLINKKNHLQKSRNKILGQEYINRCLITHSTSTDWLLTVRSVPPDKHNDKKIEGWTLYF